jgi:hypothetical protein
MVNSWMQVLVSSSRVEMEIMHQGLEKVAAMKTLWITNFSSGPGINSWTLQ